MRLCRGFTMAINIIHYILLVFWTIQLVVCDERSSLTFVIDDTASMSDDIAQVMKGANDIFDTVMNSNTSKIENYILVTFNDPKKMLRTITKDRKRFKHDLSSISVHGGGDCPEMSMSGIELALENSLPGSYLYVFTDASAKDYHNFERVKTLSQKKQCQVVFVLTGICGKPSSPDYLVYHKLAKATSGQVFHLDKDEVKKILAYVTETVKSKRVTIASKEFKPGYGNNITFGVDNQMKGVMLSVSGSGATVDVTGPDGSKPSTRDIVRTTNIAVVKVEDTKPGLHTATVGSRSNTAAVISAETSVDFKIGFSAFQPSNIKETATRPLPDEKSYLSVKLIIEKGNVELKTVQILDMEGNVIVEKPVVLIEEKGLFYVATEPVVPPNEMFKVAIQCYDVENKTPITRISSTSIEPQKTWTNKVANKEPEVLIEGINPFISKIKLKYGQLLELKCKVNAYPKPGVIWQDDTGSILPSKTFAIELPYDYISVLKVDNAKNNTYKCKASNILGESNSEVEIEVETFFNIVERPKDTIIEFTKEGHLTCKVEASPSANVTWYKNDKQIHEDSDYAISEDGCVLKIPNMQLSLRGFYKCRIKNALREEFLTAEVKISGLALPEIDKNTTIVKTQLGSDTIITCSIVKGTPKPKIRWFFNGAPLAFKRNVEASETMEELYLMDVSEDTAGTYRCVAMNTVGRDTHKTVLIVEMSEHPSILEVGKMMIVKSGERITLPCTVTGTPTPAVRWLANGTAIIDQRHEFYENSLSFVPTQHDSGDYTCIAENKMGTASTTIQIEVFDSIHIEPPKNSITEVVEGSDVVLPCVADGFPRPDISWTFHSIDYKIPPLFTEASDVSGSKKISGVKTQQAGLYTCTASNVGSSTNITYLLIVNAPPFIYSSSPNDTYTAVAGDLLFRIPCNATGNPKPDINWLRDGRYISSGTDWFDIESDGTLVIKRIDKNSAGVYKCTATNQFGNYFTQNTLIVKPELPTSLSITLEEGVTSSIKCGVPYDDESERTVQWYKDGRILISEEKLMLKNVSKKDAGVYTCNVSTPSRSRSSNTKVAVGRKPKFITREEEVIDLEQGMIAVMNCEANGEPKPQVTWWHNGNNIPLTDMTYSFEMLSSDVGKYFCVIKNDYGKVIRKFILKEKECELNIKNNFIEAQPLMLSPTLLEPARYNTDNEGNMHIPANEEIVFSCPTEFKIFPQNNVRAICNKKTTFVIDGIPHNYTELKCKDKWQPVARRTGHTCHGGLGETILIGYLTNRDLVEIYEVCLDMKTRIPLYTKHDIYEFPALIAKDVKWSNDSMLPYDYDSLYDCDRQLSNSEVLRGEFNSDRCCFTRRQLVSPGDLTPGLSQLSAFSYLNVVPQWSCYEKNWDEVIRRVSELPISATHYMTVFTGTAQTYDLPSSGGISDANGLVMKTPRYLWKVVWDPIAKASLAIIQINVPNLKPSDLYSEIRCNDICKDVEWMQGADWRNVKKGYIYCCSITDFERAFGFDMFDENFRKSLNIVSALPMHYMS